ncbi:hypothetical protein MRB53_028996 [Persea americana]|uniref:Uncharacterized protein n=1 Tax=Persea americana TaxID=3435 RepID=A0ACC2KHG7_PERAE|nr:hypothetical protein MRB53_028996 [Persea americana]|eukprot:TRINITY_DN4248_c0_g2_i1.p2 TRINITY_DN4248_c0_g2~~TRINITY_DN4248_c0_g2_i1.p2  ORF type:complete len:153 (+),score=25.36 TRINITY_DN4248_c0_g2_i1:279-737(+)
MGNYISCIPQKSVAAKLIDSRGNLRSIETPIKAAELMLEEPGHVICPAEELKRTRRVIAMKAEGELLAGKVYLLFPVSRVNSRVSESDMARIDAKKKKKKNGKIRVFPEGEEVRVCLGGGDEKGEDDTGFIGHRKSNYRQWRPVLETINEGT